MFGIFCKGLHCAGCGKGAPAGIIITLIAVGIAASHKTGIAVGNAINSLEVGLIWVSVGIVAASIIVFLAVHAITHKSPILGMRWDSDQPGYSTLTQSVPEWPEKPAMETTWWYSEDPGRDYENRRAEAYANEGVIDEEPPF